MTMRIASSDLAARLGRWDGGTGPLYRRLTDGLRRLLEVGAVTPGSRLPPERKLARTLAVSRTTVSAAYAELRRLGWVDARQGSATTVLGNHHSPVAAYVANGMFATLMDDNPDVTDLTISVPDAAPIVKAVMADPGAHLEDLGDLTEGHGYHPRGHPRLRTALAATLELDGLPTAPDGLIVTSGAQQAIALAVRAFVRPGDVVLTEETTFPGAVDAVRQQGGRIVTVPMGDGGVDLDALEEAIHLHRPALAYLIPTFHNPTGRVLDTPHRRQLGRLVAETETIMIDDLTLAALDLGSAPPPSIAAITPEAPVLSVGGMSKIYWGGLRIGWLRASPPVIDRLTAVKASDDLGTGAPTQVLAAAMLDHHSETVRWRNEALSRSLTTLTNALAAALPEWEFEPPHGGPHLWIRLPATGATEFSHRLLRGGIAVVAGPLLAPAGDTASDHIRIPYYRPPEELEHAVERMADVWHHRHTAARVGRN